MQELTPDGHRVLSEIAQRHGVSLDAARALLASLLESNGSQAQFNHPDLGGMGQWSQGGMIMIGDMFNQNLKYRVSELCNELAGYVRNQPPGAFQSQSQSSASGVSLFVAGSHSGGQWWPQELGSPASAGAQNDMRYAYFPHSRRLAILQGGVVRVYDSGDHKIAGFSQAQGGDQTLTFTSQLGLISVANLALVSPLREPAFGVPHPPDRQSEPPRDAPAPVEAPAPIASPRSSQISGDAIFAAIERLADLRQKNILSEEEFAAKKRELLGRL
jgi:Short C-terminal domain